MEAFGAPYDLIPDISHNILIKRLQGNQRRLAFLIIDELRETKRDPVHHANSFEWLIDPRPNPEEIIQSLSSLDQASEVFQTRRHLVMFVMYHYWGVKQPEIARVFGISTVRVSKILSQALVHS